MSATAAAVVKRLKSLADAQTAISLQRFFKTAKGEYAEGDKFLGIKVTVSRGVAKEFAALPMREVEKLLHSPYHEARLVALLIMVRAHQKGDDATRNAMHRLYLANTKHVNNWDLVDTSAEQLVGAHIGPGRHDLLARLARSALLWERRIAIIATFKFIRQGYYAETLRIAEILLHDQHDLIHKAVGWMLREVGGRELATERKFLDKHCPEMPRTMLRYAIEKFEEVERQRYLACKQTKRGS